MQIAIKTRLGSTALAIKAVLKADKVADAAKLAATHIVFHKAGGKAREEGADVQAVVKTALGDLFENIEIVESAWAKPDRILALAKQLGVPQDKLAEFVAGCKAVDSKEAVKSLESAIADPSDEVVG